ncbi:ABC transporter ATP-binding protein [Salinigranum halophilum]|jgi:iron(III) transport system ATP-binding protein|uniref:ABC transporter ATP-binding protein n=1 Tax=Salinigranum halophilum TaxID=2565931 RepID=UPI00115F74F2|nr:ABC transporter ATP-binding protein [Salinigranum halophilum]
MSDSVLSNRDGRTEPGSNSTTASDAQTPVLALEDLSKRFGSEPVIDDLSLSVTEGEILTLLGPSGCGKTTTLRLIAGLERPDSGVIRLNGDPVSGDGSFVAPEERGVGVVFQEFALFPHLTAAENVAFGLQDLSADETDRRVDDLLDLVGLEAQADSYPDELSGGQQQRVALARSLAPEPEILLLDEPFSNLDVDLRVAMREEVRDIIKAAGVTAISVTHDQEEAMSISDRVAVVNDGQIEQIGEPESVFQHPKSRFVAGFLGYASFIPGRVVGDIVETDVGSVPRAQIHGLAPEYDDTCIDILVRPDDVRADPVSVATDGNGDGDDGIVGNAEVKAKRYLGPTILYEVALDDGSRVQCMHNHDEQVPLDSRVDLTLQADHELAWFPCEQRPAIENREDQLRHGADD